MGKFDKKAMRQKIHPPVARGPMRTAATPTVTTHQGGAAYTKYAKTELFQLAVTNMVGEGTFYESAAVRDGRFAKLVRAVAVADPAWVLGFAGWLRGEANMRSASLVLAAEAVKARLDDRGSRFDDQMLPVQRAEGVNRQLIASVLQRADEPGEMLAYWTSRYGRKLPKPVKRGVADAVQRLYTEYSLLKYDTASHGFRFADVLDLTHPAPAAPWQGDLFRYALDRRHGRDTLPSAYLSMVLNNRDLRATVGLGIMNSLLNADALKAAGMTWEDALSLAGSKVDKAKLWEAMIPNMGYMALLRNLRNFDQAGVSDKVAERVMRKLTDPAEVARSRQLPFRFYSAYVEAPSDRWKYPLGVALDHAMANVPQLPGKTLVLIDTSGSMTSGAISARSQVTPAQAAAVLGIVLGKRLDADVWQWASTRQQFWLTKGASALNEIARFLDGQNRCGGGTDLAQALAAYSGHDRVFVFSDMQTMSNRPGWGYNPTLATYDMRVPAHVPVYAFDLQGYHATPFTTAKPNRHQLGGFTDRVFSLVPLLERGHDAGWPWETPGDSL